MEDLINQSEVNEFLSKIEHIFPNFVAGVVCDYHGFPIASKIPNNFPIQENLIALLAISNKKELFINYGYLNVKKNIDRAKNINLILLLEESAKNMKRLKKLNKLIKRQNLF